MNKVQPNEKRCDCCGRITAKFRRRYKEMSFCTTCYNHEFQLKLCFKCNTPISTHIKETKPICTNCSRATPCIRCGKIAKKLGKTTQYGNVCPSCSVYFREPHACANCGKITTRLSKKDSLGFTEPVCNQCFTLDHASCQACGRYRKLNLAHDGRLLCKHCRNESEKLCTQCTQLMPAGYGKICQDCYYKNLLKNRTLICIKALTNQFYVDLFSEFSTWLENDFGTNKAAITINKHFLFFYNLNFYYPDAVPDYCELINQAEFFHLRTNSLPMRFLCSSKRMVVDAQAKQNEMNRQMIQKYMNQNTGIPNLDKLLINYYQHLIKKNQQRKTTLRSVRLALMPAAKLLSITALAKKECLNQSILNKLLNYVPGQYAAIYGFVMFCKKQGESIEMPSKSNVTTSHNRITIERELINHIKLRSNILNNVKFKTVALAYFHRMKLSTAKTIVLHSTFQELDDHFFTLHFRENSYLIPTFQDPPIKR